MDIANLKAILATFTDQPGSLLVEKGKLLVQIGEEVISADISIREGQVVVAEGGVEQNAESWLVHRIANLDLLADRILTTISGTSAFVRPRGELIDQVERTSNDNPTEVPNALETVQEFLGRRPAGTCSVLYLTSDAGEGKTTLINHLARLQAVRFREKKTDWLLVPISLGGRPFLRFDDVVAAALMNQLRFRRLFFEAFVHLVRLGYIVPALDGFEEIFVESDQGDAVSSLGTLIRQMEGEGTLLIAARKAYFEFKGLDCQAKLLDALPESDVAFGRLKLTRWGADEFRDYCTFHQVADAAKLYTDLAVRLGFDHPLLTRAVFVRRLVEIANSGDREKFLNEIRPEMENYFTPFIDNILEREISEKWIDKYGEPPQPLLSVQEHHELLGLIAEEMWISKTGSLTTEMCSSLSDLFCDTKHLSPLLTRQVRERLPQHALLVSVGSPRDQVAFDHDHFREFFLGEQLGMYLAGAAKSDLRKLLRIEAIPGWALDTAVTAGLARRVPAEKLLTTAIETAQSESPTSFVRENCGAICVRLLERHPMAGVVVQDTTFPTDALQGRNITNVEFRSCDFRQCSLLGAALEKLKFQECVFDHIELSDVFVFDNVTFSDCKIHGLTVQKIYGSVDIYDPAKINRYCQMIGATIEGSQTSNENSIDEVTCIDQEIQIIRKLLTIFMRSTQVADHVLELRMGIHSHKFFSDVQADLLSTGVLEEVRHTGSGTKNRYRLGIPVSRVEEALSSSNGSYTRFLDLVRSMR